jgi:hypothetical protein
MCLSAHACSCSQLLSLSSHFSYSSLTGIISSRVSSATPLPQNSPLPLSDETPTAAATNTNRSNTQQSQQSQQKTVVDTSIPISVDKQSPDSSPRSSNIRVQQGEARSNPLPLSLSEDQQQSVGSIQQSPNSSWSESLLNSMSFLFKGGSGGNPGATAAIPVARNNDSNVPTPSHSPPPSNQAASAPLAVPQPYLQQSSSFNSASSSSSISGRGSLGESSESRSRADSPSGNYRMPTFHSGSISSNSAVNLLGGSLGGTSLGSSAPPQQSHTGLRSYPSNTPMDGSSSGVGGGNISEPSTPPPNERELQRGSSVSSTHSYGVGSLQAPQGSFLMGKQLMTNVLMTPSSSLPSTPNTGGGRYGSMGGDQSGPAGFGELSLAAASGMYHISSSSSANTSSSSTHLPHHVATTAIPYQSGLPAPASGPVSPAVRASPSGTPPPLMLRIPSHPIGSGTVVAIDPNSAAGTTTIPQTHIPTSQPQYHPSVSPTGSPTQSPTHISPMQQSPPISTPLQQQLVDAASEKVAAIRSMFSSRRSTLSKAIFQLGDTLGTGTFGRVRIVTYTHSATPTNTNNTDTHATTTVPTTNGNTTTTASPTTATTDTAMQTSPASTSTAVITLNKPLYFALKMLKKSEIIRLKQVEHIKAEKSILSRISHPFIVNLYTAFQDERNLYMTMEYVIGGELFSQLRKVGRFSNETARYYAAEIILALAYLHSLDIVYRDLKPENLLM